MLIQPNLDIWKVTEFDRPDPKKRQATRLFEAALDGQQENQVEVIVTEKPRHEGWSPRGTSEEAAARQMRRYIAAERARLDKLEQELEILGAHRFIEPPQPWRLSVKHPNAKAALEGIAHSKTVVHVQIRKPGHGAILGEWERDQGGTLQPVEDSKK